MKKYISLMSILALAACASGGSPDGRFTVTSTSRYAYISGDAVQSNKNITSMDSEVIVCDNGGCPAHLNRYIGSPSHQRAASSVQNGEAYKVYDLTNVSFTTADEGFDPGEESFTFLVSDGKDGNPRGQIIGIDMGFAKEDSFNKEVAELKRKDAEGNVFSGYVNDPDNNTDSDKWKPADYEYTTLGKNLRFSDFGKITITRTDIEDAEKKKLEPVFIGGYESKKIDPKDIDVTKDNTIEFSGVAAGSVTAIRNGQGSGETISLNDNNAKLKLTVDKTAVDAPIVTSELNANFTNWYDVKYTESNTSKNLELSNYASGANADYKMLTAEQNGKVSFSGDNLKSDIRYYGGDKPVEAVGLIQVRDCNGNTCNNDYGDANNPKPEVRMNLGFGVTVDNPNTNN